MTTANATKAVNYTPAQEAEMVAKYSANPTAETVAKLATAFGKTTRSVIAKLARLDVYVKPETATKGEAGAKKAEMAKAIGVVLGMPSEVYETLEKASKPALDAIFKALANSKPISE
jgi:hypothetical protein